ncbi:hypothetical protein [Microbacterium lacticum]
MLAVVDAAHVFRGEPATSEFVRAAEAIIVTNVVEGDSLNRAHEIVFIEYTPLPDERFQRVPSELEPPVNPDLFYLPPDPLPNVHYSELGA